jgi:hypothetical protein
MKTAKEILRKHKLEAWLSDKDNTLDAETIKKKKKFKYIPDWIVSAMEEYLFEYKLEATANYNWVTKQNRKLEELIENGIILTQEWYEDSEERTGWVSSGWDEPDGYVLERVLDSDKYGHPIKAVFVRG